MAQYIETATDRNVEGIEFFVSDDGNYLYVDKDYTIKAKYEDIKHAFEMNDIVIVFNNGVDNFIRPYLLSLNEGVATIHYIVPETNTETGNIDLIPYSAQTYDE